VCFSFLNVGGPLGLAISGGPYRSSLGPARRISPHFRWSQLCATSSRPPLTVALPGRPFDVDLSAVGRPTGLNSVTLAQARTWIDSTREGSPTKTLASAPVSGGIFRGHPGRHCAANGHDIIPQPGRRTPLGAGDGRTLSRLLLILILRREVASAHHGFRSGDDGTGRSSWSFRRVSTTLSEVAVTFGRTWAGRPAVTSSFFLPDPLS